MNQPSFVVVFENGPSLRIFEQSIFTKNQQREIIRACAHAGEDQPIPPGPAMVDHNGKKVARWAIPKTQYTGDMCDHCYMLTMKRAEHCLVCDSCGETTGCS